MDKLDEDKSTKSLARPRDIGDSILRSPPLNAKPWMIAQPTDQPEEGRDEGLSPIEFSDEEDN